MVTITIIIIITMTAFTVTIIIILLLCIREEVYSHRLVNLYSVSEAG